MMSLTRTSLMEVVQRQYLFKLKSYSQVFMTLVVLQVLAMLFSFNGVGMMGSSSASVEVDIQFYSADIVVGFTMLWAFITAILITTKAYRNDDFAFVTNRLSSNLSNLFFLLTASILGGILAILSSYLIKVIMYFLGRQFINSVNVMDFPVDLLIGITATIFYVLLASALGYFIGTLVQLNKIFVVFIPVLFFGSLFIGEVSGKGEFVNAVFEFIFNEPSLLVFIGKIIVTAGLLFGSTFVLSNRMEVKQ
jgi:hypothetical protein